MKYKTYSQDELKKKKIVPKPGNFIVTHTSSFLDTLIHIFTGSRWNHAALVVSANGNLIELESSGIRKNTLKAYSSTQFHLVDVELSKEDRKQVVTYAKYMLKKHASYGFLTVASIAFKIVTHSRFVIKLDGTLICSEFVAKSLAEGGIIWDKDTSLISPGDLYNKFVKK
jgi:uncharacterized protein YycO